MGPFPDATAVFDIDSIGLTNVVARLNAGADPGGNSIGDPTRYVIGASLDQNTSALQQELERFAWKVDAGADFAVTEPLFDPGKLHEFLTRNEAGTLPIVVTLWPLTSLRMAEYLANEVPSVFIPAPVVDRMRHAQLKGPAAARAEGLAIAREAFEGVREVAAGVRVSSPFGGLEPALALLELMPH